jgi:glutamine amidotransferase
MIVIPALPLGNFASILRVIDKCGGYAELIDSPISLRKADKIILAGVGAFDYGMTSINSIWREELENAVLVRRIPILGICLGMQLMCKSSEEGHLPGLGWIDAKVRRFSWSSDFNLKLPHMGWNTVKIVKSNSLLEIGNDEQRFYFVHSYHVICNNPRDVLATAHYGYDFTAAINHENIFGVQFHPEKSHRFGIQLVSNFLRL